MLGAWIIRTPSGTYSLRLRTRSSTWPGVAERAEREAIWFFAKLDIRRFDPHALAEATALDELLGGVPLRLGGAVSDRWMIDRLVYRLETAVEDRLVDFEQRVETTHLSWGHQPHTPPPPPTPTEQHWLDLEILDDETLEPVAGVLVSLKLADGSVTQRTTDAEGRIYLDGQPNERWEIIDVDAPVEIVTMA